MSDETLINQSEARAEAKRLNDAADHPVGMVNIAQRVPAEAWGGQERGWTVALVPAPGNHTGYGA